RTMALMARCGGLALLTDDPPNTGASLAATAEALERRGLGRDSILVLLPTFGDGTPPARLQPYETLPLPWRRWAIHERLAAPAVRAALSRLLPGRTIQLSPAQGGHQRVTVGSVVAVERLELAPLADVKVGSPVRRHVRALFRAQIVDGETGAQFEHHVYVKGAGLGYLGRHSLAVAEPLADFLPEVYGVDGGLLFRAWLPEAGRLSCPSTEGEAAVAERIAAYVAARRRALATPEDRSRGLGGLNPLWQRAANLLDPAFGRAGLLMRPLLGRVTRRMFAVKHPSVIDGSMALSQWFAPSPAGAAEAAPLLKADYDERAFSNQDTLLDQIYSYDAVYDLASAAADAELDPDLAAHGFPELLRRAYEAMTGDGVAAERWFLYQVLCLAGHQKFLTSMLTQAPADVSFAALSADPAYARAMEATLVDGITRAQRALARVQQHCLTRQFLADTETPEAGPLCGIDIDGVLETVWLGFPASTPAGCLALRALLRHGCRPLLVSGRSLDEVRERCIAYRLPGGVAEYGAVTYVHAAGSVRELLSDLQRADLNSLRETLRGIEGVYVDPDYQRAVRAYRFGRDGRRHALKRETVEAALANSGTRDRLRVIAGNAQTDFMAAGTDKGTGLGVLVSELTQHDDSALHSGGGKPLVLAVGDTSSDLPMFELARLACAPALADDEAIAPGVKRMQGRYQAGLAEAAGLLLGHRPGACPVCRPPSPSAEAELLLTILAAQDTGYRGKLRQALRLLRQQARRPREP
ncbi:MAG TPA: hypothetical protein VND24_03115, partial [Steroidobacteraceae bacterium]|nr:hypothetical protein [Steroidobacteraceae bacterium]